MQIVDAHQDIAFNEVALGRNFLHSAAEKRAAEGARSSDIATIGLPDALAGGVGLTFATIFVAPDNQGSASNPHTYRNAEEAYTRAHAQIAIYRRLAEHPRISLIMCAGDLEQLKATWQSPQPQLGIVLLMENADPIRTPAECAEWHAAGVRLVGPAWAATRYCGGTGAPGPLTSAGRELMTELQRARLALDVSHMAEESFWQALDLFDGPVVATHANCRALVPGRRPDRHLSDEMIRALIARDATIGVVLFGRFLDDGWTPAQGKAALGLDAVVRHIDHICQIAGNTRHVGIGSDLDGGFGSEAIPREIDTIADLPRLADALAGAGYTGADIEAIMGGNWLRQAARFLP